MPEYIQALHRALWAIPSGREHAERRDLLREQLFRAYRWTAGRQRPEDDPPWKVVQ